MRAEHSRQGLAIEANHIKIILACLSGTLLPGSIPGGSLCIFVLSPTPFFLFSVPSIALIYFEFTSYLYKNLVFLTLVFLVPCCVVSLSADT